MDGEIGQFGGRCRQWLTMLRIPAAPEESVGRGTASKSTEVKICVKGNSVHDSYLSWPRSGVVLPRMPSLISRTRACWELLHSSARRWAQGPWQIPQEVQCFLDLQQQHDHDIRELWNICALTGEVNSILANHVYLQLNQGPLRLRVWPLGAHRHSSEHQKVHLKQLCFAADLIHKRPADQ
jgi:hypothetical protein